MYKAQLQEARKQINISYSRRSDFWLRVTYRRLAVKCRWRWTSGLWAGWTAEPQTLPRPEWQKCRPALRWPAPSGDILQQKGRQNRHTVSEGFTIQHRYKAMFTLKHCLNVISTLLLTLTIITDNKQFLASYFLDLNTSNLQSEQVNMWTLPSG